MAAGKGAGRGGEDNNGDVRIATAVNIKEPPPSSNSHPSSPPVIEDSFPLLLWSPLSLLSFPLSVASDSQSHRRITGISNRYLFRGNPREDPDQICGNRWRRRQQ